jgi:hypothetical protein
VAEVAVSAMLLVGSGLLVRSLAQLTRLDLGFRPESMVSVEFTLPASEFREQGDRVRFSQRVLSEYGRWRVVAAGHHDRRSAEARDLGQALRHRGAPPPEPGEVPWAAYRAVSRLPRSARVSLVRGRTFGRRPGKASKVAIVSRELARRAGRRGSHREKIGHPTSRRRVGPVDDRRGRRGRQGGPLQLRIDRPVWYVPYEQAGNRDPPEPRAPHRGAPPASAPGSGAVRELYPEVRAGESTSSSRT